MQRDELVTILNRRLQGRLSYENLSLEKLIEMSEALKKELSVVEDFI